MATILDLWEETGSTGGAGDKGVRTYRRVFRCKTDDPTVSEGWVLDNSGVPLLFYPYLTPSWNDLAALVRQVECKREDNPYLFTITIDYSSKTEDPRYADENPLNRPPKFAWSQNNYKIAATVDQDGLAYVNSATEDFDPAVETEKVELVLTYTRNIESWDPSDVPDTTNVVNDSDWFGFDTRTCKISERNAQDKWEGGLNYFEEVFVIRVRSEINLPGGLTADPWADAILDQGYYELVGGVKRLILDTAGRAVSQPHLLNGSGLKLTAGSSPVFIIRRPYPDIDFSTLNIP